MRRDAGAGRAAFPRHARLTDSRAFSRVFADATRVADAHFTVLFRTQPEPGEARVGLAVSRRAAPRAVDRNRIKRIVRECFRRERHHLPNVDIVVIARPKARHVSRAVLHRSVSALFARVQRRCAGS
ncbi:ribonuclease P protein component [Arhodomonas aquaeolei]|uniref:ribonuclease P protein component n=1 Tax=Arhodomonas TaxID=2368 RepID=UPI00037B9372|nr:MULTISPECIES: ribonuclease P protein component [Arhodomonas]MCS4504958.1 ribonuclease P protein component [Arhodomonas aquaeolei]